DQDLEPRVLLVVRRRLPPQPRVEARGRDLEHGAHHNHRPHGLLRQNERELHAFSFAKKATAFPRMSRSIRATRTSLRRRTSSARSSVVSPLLPPSRSARARFTQLPNADGVRSRSRATSATCLPSSRTSRTAPARNSAVNVLRARL